jgi:hypothetical protein
MLIKKVNKNGYQGKSQSDYDGINYTKNLDKGCVFVMLQAKCLKCRLKGMTQMECQK